jgi:hypothetical protein
LPAEAVILLFEAARATVQVGGDEEEEEEEEKTREAEEPEQPKGK